LHYESKKETKIDRKTSPEKQNENGNLNNGKRDRRKKKKIRMKTGE